MSPLEAACGSVLGLDSGVAPLRRGSPGATARAALEQDLLLALQRGPCVVSFSGGRDSSAVLAVATHVARREGLPLPVPATLRFPECSDAFENEWQELVIDHLELPDWERVDYTDEMDVVGPIATPVLRRHGVLWPFNTFFHVPIMRLAAGGTVVTGVGGDELFSDGWAWHRENLISTRRTDPIRFDSARVIAGLGPRQLRLGVLRHRDRSKTHHPSPWLLPEAIEAINDQRLQTESHQTLSFQQSLRDFWWPHRARTVGLRSLATLADDHGVSCRSPLAESAVLGAALRESGWRMYRSRTEAMQHLVEDLLPAPLTARRTKASFNGAFFNRHARAFSQAWDGEGVDTAIVDPAALKAMWTSPTGQTDARTFMLLQTLWCEQQPHQTDSGLHT